jgi:hypothetical protein
MAISERAARLLPDEGAWSASLERELWQLRIRTTDWRRLNATMIDAPTLHRAPVVVRAGPRLLRVASEASRLTDRGSLTTEPGHVARAAVRGGPCRRDGMHCPDVADNFKEPNGWSNT